MYLLSSHNHYEISDRNPTRSHLACLSSSSKHWFYIFHFHNFYLLSFFYIQRGCATLQTSIIFIQRKKFSRSLHIAPYRSIFNPYKICFFLLVMIPAHNLIIIDSYCYSFVHYKFHKNPPFSTPYYFTDPFYSGAHRPLTRSKKKDGNSCVERGKTTHKKSKYNTQFMCCTYFTTNNFIFLCIPYRIPWRSDYMESPPLTGYGY